MLIATSIMTSAYSNENLLSVFGNAHTNTNLTAYLQNGLIESGINLDKEIPENRLAAINFILRNTIFSITFCSTMAMNLIYQNKTYNNTDKALTVIGVICHNYL